MSFLMLIILTLLVSLLGGLYLLGTFRLRRPNEPPLDKGNIPWLGHVLNFRKNTAQFLQKMQKKHGDIFTIELGGVYITFLMDPLSFGSVVKEPRTKLDFEKYAKSLVARVFNYYSRTSDIKYMHESSAKYLTGDGLEIMNQALVENLQNLLLHCFDKGASDSAWHQDGLFHFTYNHAFRAGYLSLFGNESSVEAGSKERSREIDIIQSEEIFCEFRKYDLLFPRLAYGVLPPQSRIKAERLKRYFWNKMSVKSCMKRDNVSGWVTGHYRYRAENGMKEYMQDRYNFALLWASQGNTGPSTFWLILNLLKDPVAMKAVQEEIDHVIEESGQEVTPGGQLLNITKGMLSKTLILDSALEETLRMTTAPMLMRSVVMDMNLKMADGREYGLRKGDRVAMFPYTTVHVDPEIHPLPFFFKYNRFLNTDGTKRTDFYKNGKKVKYYNMPWGAGISMCPGRFFAMSELKIVVFLMLTYFDFELVNPKEKVPPLDQSRWGFGTIHPTHDVQFRYRLRF